MSIQQTGPKGYELQYLGTVWITLVWLKDKHQQFQAFVEKTGGEDAEIRHTVGNDNVIVEVQSKSEKGPLDQKALTKWLCHFPERSENGCLLERLLQEKHRSTVFIAWARCTDVVNPFRTPLGQVSLHSSFPIEPKEIPVFADTISAVYDSDGKGLEKRRADTCAKLRDQLNDDVIATAEALQRVCVWEEVTEIGMTEAITQLLQRHFRIPASECEDAIMALVKAVTRARDQGCDVVPLLRAEVDRRAANRMVREELHTPRGDEESLFAELEKEHALLLTGRSRCGKTHIGRQIAQRLQDAGWTAMEGSSLQVAEEFLLPGPADDRVFLLDDPLFGNGPFSNSASVWGALSRLVQRLTPGRRLIVTAKIDTLLEISPGFTPSRPDIYSLCWHDLTSRNRDFLQRYWEDVSRMRAIPQEIVTKVCEALQNLDEIELPQAGQLRHLAFGDAADLARLSDADALLRFARINAEELAERFANDDAATRDLCFALGIGGSISRDIKCVELAYLIGQNEEYPALNSDDFGLRRLTPTKDPKPSIFPAYTSHPSLEDRIKEELRRFERRGYIYYNAVGLVKIAHPDYREAFQRSLFKELPSGYDNLVKLARRGLGALDPQVGVATVRWIVRWWKECENDTQNRVIELLFSALNDSIFPDVRHSARLALLRHIDSLDDKESANLLQNVSHSENDNDTLVWNREIAWLDRDPERDWLSHYLREHRTLPRENIDILIECLKDDQQVGLVSASQCDAVNTHFLQEHSLPVDSDALLAIMQRPEAFLRIDSAALLLRGSADVDAKMRNRVFGDEDPVVLVAAVRSVIENWNQHYPVCEDLQNDLLAALGRLSVAVALASAMCKRHV